MAKTTQISLYDKYVNEVIPALKDEFKVKNVHALPRLTKVIVNMGLKKAKEDKTVIDEALRDMALITGQKPIVTKARKSISNFSLRQGNPIGCKVTLRRSMMFDFLEKLLRIAIPRIRDFSGLKRSVDSSGNLTIGIREESIFPEIDADNLKTMKGMSITVVTDKLDREKSGRMFDLLGFPFIRKEEEQV